MSLGIPIKLLHEAEGQIVTIELKNHEVMRGYLDEAEDNFNMHVTNITRTEKDGRVTHLDHAYIRGSQIRFMILPDMLKNAPMFRKKEIKNAPVAAPEPNLNSKRPRR